LPVSSTHIAVGAVFGVGFFREYYTTHSRRRLNYVKIHPVRHVHRSLTRRDRDKLRRRKLVRRSHFIGIVAAWVITVPAAAALAALMFLGVSRFL
jgi:PiT family inorganic phosphate transporter